MTTGTMPFPILGEEGAGRSIPFVGQQKEQCPLLLVASLFLVVRPGAPNILAPSSDARSP